MALSHKGAAHGFAVCGHGSPCLSGYVVRLGCSRAAELCLCPTSGLQHCCAAFVETVGLPQARLQPSLSSRRTPIFQAITTEYQKLPYVNLKITLAFFHFS